VNFAYRPNDYFTWGLHVQAKLSIGQINSIIRYPDRRPGRRFGFRPVADRLELSRHVDLRSTQKSRKLVADPHELVERQVGNQVCDQVGDLDSVMEFGLMLLDHL